MVGKWFIAGVLLTSGGAWSQTPATLPTNAPASQPAATRPAADATTPKGALRLLFSANDTGDVQKIRSVLYTASPTEERMADTMAQMASAIAQLQKALSATFGEEQTKSVLGNSAEATKIRDAMVDRLGEEINGDEAVIHMESVPGYLPVELKKVDGLWKVRVGKPLEKADPALVEKHLAMLAIQIKVYRDAATDVLAGKHKSVEDVKQTLEARVRQGMMQYIQDKSKAAATQPAAPATQP